MLTSHLRRIQIQLFSNFVEVNLKPISRLRRAVSALRTTGRFISEDARALEFVTRHFVRHRLQRAGVERARDAIASISAAVEKGLEVHSSDRTIFLDTGLDVHENGMPAAMAIENIFARQDAFHWSAGDHRQLRNDHFVVERIALAAKAATVGSSNNANMTRGQAEDLRQSTMNVMRRLRRTPKREFLVRIEIGNRRVLLHRQMRIALIKEGIFAN